MNINLDPGLKDRVQSNVSTAASSLDISTIEHETYSATRAGAERTINMKESAKAGYMATIENPPMKTITDSSKKGSSSRQVVDENAVSAARSQLAQLEVQISSLQTEKDTAASKESAALVKKETSQSELDENITQLSVFNETDKLLTKFTDAFSGTDGFANKGEEDAALKRLTDYTNKIKDWGDVDGDGIDDGKHYADAVDSFLYGEGGYFSQDRKYESDYTAEGKIPPWKQAASSNNITDSSGTGLAGDTSSSDLYKRVFG